ncbi:MAG: type IV secretion system protein [Sulfurimonas sp.]|jgi:type IV secretion system protein VirB6|uniref:type IV secretion system protein n=1 Tax=Sulfurimonas sp. TaxID=2022749 RepID=UPI003569940B
MFFQHIGQKLDKIFKLIEDASSSDMVNQLAVLITVWITIIIMIKGYMTLAGKSQDPIRELVWDIAIKVMIMVFVLNIGGYLTLVTDAMDALHSWAGGGISLYSKLDDLLAKTKDLTEIVINKDSDMIPLTGIVAALLIYAGFLIASLQSLIVIVITQFVLKLVVMLAPFMFFALIFGWLKNMFTQWLSIFFANLLTVLIVTLLFNAVIDNFAGFIKYSTAGAASGLDLIYIGIEVLIFGILLATLIAVSKDLAEKIATVGFEGVMQSEFGKSISGAGRGAKSAGRGAAATGRGAAAAGKSLMNRWRR